MSTPADRKYSETHEWYQVDGSVITMGITQFAADELTDITYVELPEVGLEIEAGAVVGEIESVKATSELNCAIAGKVVAVNGSLAERPELVNEDALGGGWMLKIEVGDLAALNNLMDEEAYKATIG